MSEAVSRSRTDHRVSSLRQKGLGGGGAVFLGSPSNVASVRPLVVQLYTLACNTLLKQLLASLC